ncbi:MAG: hypothetical protein JRF61_11285 [Deltaproteobacteria bacterium]|nr:hypothetical protein [Deltaproteobacteria bacterium]
MSATAEQPAVTALRAIELHTRGLPLEAQMDACIDLLQHPEVAVEDLVRSVAQVHVVDGRRPGVEVLSDQGALRGPGAAFFYASRELFVKGDRGSFTCLATGLELRQDGVAGLECRPVDYAAVTCEAQPRPVLGFVQSAESESAYPLLLRALSTLIELVRPRRFDLLDREVYRGLLGPAPVFDLALVLWDDELEPNERRPLCELSRDLAEVFKRALAAEPRFPPILNDIVCLRMNQKRFDGRLRSIWRV